MTRKPLTECAYCYNQVPDSGDNPIPAKNDGAAWIALARDHRPECEWIATRAHQQCPKTEGVYDAEALAAGREWREDD